ncbi:MAG: hypothetical protein P8J32_02675 [bacterium]|nr:hypothetical protein [bacterium]
MNNQLRKLIREAVRTVHAYERTRERLFNAADIRPAFPSSYHDSVMNKIRWVQEHVQFDKAKSYQIHLFNLPSFYQHWERGESEASSQGDMLYLLVRNNKIVSVFFRRKPQRGKLMPQVDYEVNVSMLEDMVEQNGGNKIPFSKPPAKQGSGSRKKVQMELPIVVLRGKPWYIDEPNGILIYSKNTKKTISIDDALDTLPEEEAEKLIDSSYWEMPAA